MTRSNVSAPAVLHRVFRAACPPHAGLLLTAIAFIGLPGSSHAQTDPLLGVASGFAVLAGSTVTNTGTSFIQGDVGVNPGTAMTGFTKGMVSPGTMYNGGAFAQQAQDAASAAYTDLRDRTFTRDLSGTDLGSRTLIAGIYHFSSSAQLTGPLVLDGQGNADAQFVFQIGSTLTTENDSAVQLINGANARNVYWQVGSSATLGTNSTLSGSILADASITANSGAILEGRLLAHTGAVTLSSNRISAPTGAAAPEPSSVALLAGMAFRSRAVRCAAANRSPVSGVNVPAFGTAQRLLRPVPNRDNLHARPVAASWCIDPVHTRHVTLPYRKGIARTTGGAVM